MRCHPIQRLAMFLSLLLLVSGGATAIDRINPTPGVEHVVKQWTNVGAEVKGYFDGPGNLIGVAIEIMPGKGFIAYFDPSGETMITGMALDMRNERNLTAEADTAFFQTPLPRSGNDIQEMAGDVLQALPAIVEGDPAASKVLYVLFDFQCPHCRQLHQRLQQEIDKGATRVHWIPVAFTGDKAASKAAYALGDIGDTSSLASLFVTDDIAPLLKNPQRIAKGALGLERTMRFARDHHIKSVPKILTVQAD